MRKLTSSSAIKVCPERGDEAKDLLAALNIKDKANMPACVITPFVALVDEITQEETDGIMLQHYIADARIAIERLQSHYGCRKTIDFLVENKLDDLAKELGQ